MQTDTRDQPIHALGTGIPLSLPPSLPLPATPPTDQEVFPDTAQGKPEALPRKSGAPAPARWVPGDSEPGWGTAVHSGKVAWPSALFPARQQCLVTPGALRRCGSRLAGSPRRRLCFSLRRFRLARGSSVRPPTPPACLECALCGSASSRPVRSRSRRWAWMALRRTCSRCPCRRTWRAWRSGSTSARVRAPRRRRRRGPRAMRRTGQEPGPARTRTMRKVRPVCAARVRRRVWGPRYPPRYCGSGSPALSECGAWTNFDNTRAE